MTERLSDILSPATLARIDNYLLLARVVVDGFIAGLHRSVYHGFGSEFLQYRNYSPGDDLKYVDWKVFARHDKLVTKVFQEETNMNCNIVLDASASMGFQGTRAPCSKYRYGAMVAASLAYLASRQGDFAGFYCYNEELQACIRPGNRTGHLQRIATELVRIQPQGEADHERFLSYVAEAVYKRGLVVVISDFLEAEERIGPLLKRLRYAQNDCIVIQVLDNDERDFPFDATTRFVDSEHGAHILTYPPDVRDEYVAGMDAFMERLRRLCMDMQADCVQCDSTQSLGRVLASYLHRRGSVY
ncbi:MAG: DUF58 domain-containing protein [Candidatus Pacebacteria bacterium]|nr:DUF58 domain-containing protein [Candidatus Paceibacterota bacterium]